MSLFKVLFASEPPHSLGDVALREFPQNHTTFRKAFLLEKFVGDCVMLI